MSKYRIIVLTEREYEDLGHIIRNGWGDGDYEGYGLASPRTQHAAMGHFLGAGMWPPTACPAPRTMRPKQQGAIDKIHKS